ncbi:putative O-glycosylation ligase, exosortase A system-associated [Novosphingobium sp. KCTC 2891]|uniref:putative O-glycosylation ligase, exosortase A system-associated n=1 Tax=Novosphingobium sp. KCTC 2891 TaxID=2989730 RepID=UPI0022234747|nr:putative O-glycosylation ligase, exosortase A system-associated [Novosphingobium sp. KCTC 2891]MCW1382022.1 putative O-glycosylation ligase, exosortase A system-associated [Novosphingobium sp. KCTC 2891]
MLNLFLTAFVLAFLAAGVRRPYLFVLAYAYIDIVAPQKVTWGFLQSVPVSLIAFACAFGAWLVAEDKNGIRLSSRQCVLLLLLLYCGLTTRTADFPVEAAEKWGWVWKALVFALFLPLTLRTRLRIEALALIMVLSVGVIVIGGGIKTLASGGGGYGELKLLVNDNTGLYEGSIISTVAICVIPLALWLANHGTIFRPGWMVRLFAIGICFACLLMPVGTQARTGLVCAAVLGVMMLRSTKRRLLYVSVIAVGALVALPLLPSSFNERMSTIKNHQGDQSASTRLAVWQWTIDFAKDHPFGGGFDAFRQNRVSYDTVKADYAGDNNAAIETERIEETARAYHSSYFEMLGEQGYPGLALWLLLHVMGVIHMEVIRRQYAKNPPDGFAWVTPLADALQQAQIVYLVGGAFVGIAFQPFCYMLVGLQCGLSAYIGRVRRSAPVPFRKARSAPAPLPDAT